MKFLSLVGVLILSGTFVNSVDIDSKELRCLVCRTTLEELEGELAKINPSLLVDVGNYRLDASGSAIQKKVPLARSEVHISEMLDNICTKMDNYVRATYKSSGRLTILNIMSPDGGMNPEMSKVDIIQDTDLNKSLKFHCEGVVEEYEDAIVSLYSKGEKNNDLKVCKEIAQLCEDTSFTEDEESENEDRDEL